MSRINKTMSLHNSPLFYQKGVGLVEMMVVMVLGLVMLGGVGSLYANFQSTYQVQKSQADLQDGFRYSGTMMTGILRQAGYASVQVNGTVITSKDDLFVANSSGSGNFTATNQVVFGTQANTSNVPRYMSDDSTAIIASVPDDAVAIRYMGGNQIFRCLGETADQTGVQYSATFRVNSNFQLECEDEIIAGSPLVTDTDFLVGDNFGPRNSQTRVLGMAVWYGEDTTADGSVDRYRRAAAVTDWTTVQSLRIDLLVQAGVLPPRNMVYMVRLPNAPETS